MLGGQENLARQSAITRIMNSKQKAGTPVKNHMLMLMGLFAEAAKNGAELDYNTQIEMVFKTLSKDFVDFKAAYNLGNKELGLIELMRQLQAYELMINDGVGFGPWFELDWTSRPNHSMAVRHVVLAKRKLMSYVYPVGGMLQNKGKWNVTDQGQQRNCPQKKSNRGNEGNNNDYPVCAQCGKKHLRVCRLGMNACYLCGKEGHYARNCTLNSQNQNPQYLNRNASSQLHAV
ncbi:hypothetical protein TIFTF001_029087 [Ficus carica]|uniref:CCHC-type domain-containing protein n=1 Tax=Ficus carica TaxID=3494 RepID=A0AA88DR67_FICCA|nr:hypothetical protein TIFTF001_029087 [Ficus carica]